MAKWGVLVRRSRGKGSFFDGGWCAERENAEARLAFYGGQAVLVKKVKPQKTKETENDQT